MFRLLQTADVWPLMELGAQRASACATSATQIFPLNDCMTPQLLIRNPPLEQRDVSSLEFSLGDSELKSTKLLL